MQVLAKLNVMRHQVCKNQSCQLTQINCIQVNALALIAILIASLSGSNRDNQFYFQFQKILFGFLCIPPAKP